MSANPATLQLCQQLAERLLVQGLQLVTAESCTGGLLAGACTELAGSSNWFERGFVTYSNQSKTDLLGVEPALLAQAGAVSQAVAQAMVQGALARSPAQVAVAVTGIAGPGGGGLAKPVGTVWFGFALPGQLVTECHHFAGPRAEVRAASVQHALRRLLELLDGASAPALS